MKRAKLASLLITFIMLMQAIPISAAADTYQGNASESELYQSYESFMQYANENDIPCGDSFETFKAGYEELEYESTDAYLEYLYDIITPIQDTNGSQTTTLEEKLLIDATSDYTEPEFDLTDLGYDEETVEAYKAYATQAEESNIFVMCIEDFVYEYENSDLSLEEYCDVLYEEIAEEAAAQSAVS